MQSLLIINHFHRPHHPPPAPLPQETGQAEFNVPKPEDLSLWNTAELISRGAQSHALCSQDHLAPFGQSYPTSPQHSARQLATVPLSPAPPQAAGHL